MGFEKVYKRRVVASRKQSKDDGVASREAKEERRRELL